MATATDKLIPTPEEIRERLHDVTATIAQFTFHRLFVLESYPIGGAGRGQCELSYQLDPKKGYRTVRRTTDKHGRWCKPKSSTYDGPFVGVVSGGLVEERGKDAAWLRMSGTRTVYLQWANGENEVLAESPCYSAPRRKDQTYVMTCNGVPETKTLPADDPALCDAYDAWMAGLRELLEYVRQRAKEAS